MKPDFNAEEKVSIDRDANTGARVSLPSSEVKKINEEDFMAHTPLED